MTPPVIIPPEREAYLQRFYQYLRDTNRGDLAERFDQILRAPIKAWEDR